MFSLAQLSDTLSDSETMQLGGMLGWWILGSKIYGYGVELPVKGSGNDSSFRISS